MKTTQTNQETTSLLIVGRNRTQNVYTINSEENFLSLFTHLGYNVKFFESLRLERQYTRSWRAEQRTPIGWKFTNVRSYSQRDGWTSISKNKTYTHSQLKKKFEERASQKSEYTGEELTREELGEIVESAKVEGLEDFTPYSGLDYPVWMPGGMAGKAIDFFSRTVIGTGTVGGVGVHLHKDGSITPISPEDSPGFDHESMRGENVPRRYRPRLEDKVSVSETITEKEPTGIAALLARRSDKPGIGQSLQPQFDNLASIFGRDKAAEMLGQPVNIFA